MDDLSQARLNTITNLEPAALSSQQRAFLKARSEYLTAEQKKTYKEILDNDVVVEAKPEAKVASYKYIQKKAKALGLTNVVGVARQELVDFIRTAEGPGSTME